MPISKGLKTGLNLIRETSIQDNTLYHKYVDEIFDDTDIGTFATPILNNPRVMNEFISVLTQKLIYSKVNTKLFNNPLRVLEGDNLPLGSIGEEIHINPAKARKFNVDDFAGLLAKYEADVKVQYHKINSDLQYCVTITKSKLKNAFTSWNNLEDFISGMTQSLYNGAYIDQYKLTKRLVSSAYKNNSVQVKIIEDITTETKAKKFVEIARTLFLNMQTPSSEFNAWKKAGGYGHNIITWSDPSEIVFLLRNDLASYLDVNVLANSFNIDKSTLLGNIIYVDNFDEFDENGTKIFDGSAIKGIMCDKSFFKIKEQENSMDEFYNANNKTWQEYLNITRMYSYSLFANAVVFATEEPKVIINNLSYNNTTEITLEKTGDEEGLEILTDPPSANSPTIVYTSSDENVFIVEANTTNNKLCKITATGAGTGTLTAKAGNVTTTLTVKVLE